MCALLLLVAAIGLSACGDDQASQPEAPTSIASAVTLDPEINTADSWVDVDITATSSLDVVSDEPFLDPTTGATTTSATETSEPVGFHFQSGFTSGGASVAVTYHPPEPDDPDTSAVTVTKVVGSVATDYDAQGRVVPETPTDTLEGPSPLNSLPVIQAQVIIDAIVKPPADGGGGTGDQCQDCEMGLVGGAGTAALRLGASSAPTRVLLRTPTRLVLETDLSGAGGAPVLAGLVANLNADGEPVPKRVRRGYTRRMDRWVLDSASFEGEEVIDGKVHRSRSALQFRSVRFHSDHDRDAGRRAERSAAQLLRADERPAVRLTQLTKGAGPAPAITAPQTASLSAPCQDRIGTVGTSGPSVVFQHGFASGPCTWDRMEEWVLSDFRFRGRVTLQTSSFAKYDDQAFTLRTRMRDVPASEWVLIGHSNGGIVSRRAAQAEANYYAGLPIRGVLTIGSPHGGVDLTPENGHQASSG